MSGVAMAAVWEHAKGTHGQRNVLLALADRADEHGICWPGVETLMKKAKMSRRGVQYALRAHQRLGQLVCLEDEQGGRGVTPLYWIKLPGLDGSTEDAMQRRRKGATVRKSSAGKRAQSTANRAQSTASAPLAKGANGGTERVQRIAPDPFKETTTPGETATAVSPGATELPANAGSSASGSEETAQGKRQRPRAAAQDERGDGGDAETEAQTIRRLFEYWQEHCKHPRAKLTRERREKVRARLRDGYTPRQIAEGILGAERHAHVSDDGRRHDDLELICRNGTKLESFIARRDLPATAPGGEPVRPRPDADATARRMREAEK